MAKNGWQEEYTSNIRKKKPNFSTIFFTHLNRSRNFRRKSIRMIIEIIHTPSDFPSLNCGGNDDEQIIISVPMNLITAYHSSGLTVRISCGLGDDAEVGDPDFCDMEKRENEKLSIHVIRV
jgi:hypothetical protein